MPGITFRCSCCRRIRRRNQRVKHQRYCGDKRCQKARKNKWQREKQRTDPDYQANKRESQEAWKKKNPDYWQRYRRTHSRYCRNNILQQRIRDASRTDLVKKDTLRSFLHDSTTSYFICPMGTTGVKKDALAVKIIPISPG